jgi:TetR/AcrR family transcriptional regulator, cholesterol catabolism regulator
VNRFVTPVRLSRYVSRVSPADAGSSRRARGAGTRRKPTRSYEPEETKRAVVDSALQLFEKQGFHATSVQEISDNAGVSKGAFYHHFDKKEDVLRVIHDEFQDAQLQDIERILAAFETPTEQLFQIIQVSLVSTSRYRSHVTVFFQERRFLTGKDFTAVKRKRDKTERLLASIVNKGIESGEFKADLDAQIFTFSLIGMIAWTNQWFRPGGRLTAEEVGAEVGAIVMSGILADTPKKPAKRSR